MGSRSILYIIPDGAGRQSHESGQETLNDSRRWPGHSHCHLSGTGSMSHGAHLVF